MPAAPPVQPVPNARGTPPSAQVQSLARISAERPGLRKQLIASTLNHGRELLISLARVTGGWIGWTPTNLRGIAEQLAFVTLDERSLRRIGDIEQAALVNRALESCIAAGSIGTTFAKLSHSLGFRSALRDALLELRTAGVTPEQVARSTTEASPSRELAALLAAYEQLLLAGNLADSATLFCVALEV
ncbi:MAG: hypothetical protein ABIZ91_03675, partial [Gemmatimonadaceae bacterium]